MILGLLYKIPLNDVIDYIEKSFPDEPICERLKNEKLVREYVQVDDFDGWLSYVLVLIKVTI